MQLELTVERDGEEQPIAPIAPKKAAIPKKRTPSFSLKLAKGTIPGERGRFGAYWFGQVAVFLVNQSSPGEWDGKPPVDFAEWDGGCADVLALRADKPQQAEIIKAMRTTAKAKHVSPFVVELCEKPTSAFSVAEEAGYQWRLELNTAAEPAPANQCVCGGCEPWEVCIPCVVAAKQPAAPPPALSVPPTPQQRVSAETALRELCAHYKINSLSQLRQLGQAIGLAAHDEASGKPDVWGSAVALMRRDIGVTEKEIGDHFEEIFGERRVSTTRTNLAAFRLLLAGVGIGEVAITRSHEEGRGLVMRLRGIQLARDGILADLARILSRDEGASIQEATKLMTDKYPERASSVRSTVATQMAMWRSVLCGDDAAVFSLTAGEIGPIYRVRSAHGAV